MQCSNPASMTVSIQLVSPTSGETHVVIPISDKDYGVCFHSISFPNEWGVNLNGSLVSDPKVFPFN